MGKLMLAPYVRFGYSNDMLYCGFGSIQKIIENSDQQKLILEVANEWLDPKTEDEMFNYATSEKDHSKKNASFAIDFLKDNNFLISENYDKNDRYSRHHLYYSLCGADPFAVQDLLSKKHVLVVGCGGIGTQVSCALVTAGVGEITLVDFDKIELSNLTRQVLFTEKDNGEFKTEVLKRELSLRNSDAVVNSIHKKIDSLEDELPRCDLAVLSADSPGLLKNFNDYAVKTKMPYVNVGYVNDVSVWGPFIIPGETGCMDCQQLYSTKFNAENSLIFEKIKHINSQFQAPSIGPINMLSSSLATLDILRYLGEFGEIQSLNKRVGLWTDKYEFEYQNSEKNPNCHVCGN